MRKLIIALIIIGLFFLLGIAIFVYRPSIKVYSIPPARRGFILGARTDNAFLFLFYEHPSEGLSPLQEYDTLYSNELIVYALAYTDTTQENLTLHMYRLEEVKQGNQTIEIKREIQNSTVTLILRKYQIVKNEIELPTHSEKFTVEIYTSNGNMIFKFYHETHPLFLPAKRYTLGSLFMDRLAYVLSALIVIFTMLGACRYTINKRRVVPSLSVGAGLWIMTIAAIILYFTARALIYLFGLINVAWTYIPIGIAAYFFGFSLMQPKKKTLFLMKTLPGSRPTKEIKVLEVIEDRHKLYNGEISWKDFILGKKQEIQFKGSEIWSWKIINSDDELYIYRNIKEESDKIVIELEDIHIVDVDQALSKIKTLEGLASEKEHFRKKVLELLTKMEVEVDERVVDMFKLIIDRINRGLGLYIKKKEVEELKPGEQIEQKEERRNT